MKVLRWFQSVCGYGIWSAPRRTVRKCYEEKTVTGGAIWI